MERLPVCVKCFAACDYCPHETKTAHSVRDWYTRSARRFYLCDGMLYVFIRSECADAKHNGQAVGIPETGIRIARPPCCNNVRRLGDPLFIFALFFTLPGV